MSKKSSTEAYQSIRDEIIGGVIRSDQIILEQVVAQRFAISKLAAREVLQRLCNEKYLKSFPRKGYLVTDITATQLRKIQQVRFQIESFAIRLIIENCAEADIKKLYDILSGPSETQDPLESISSRFHLLLATLSQNEYIYDALRTCLGYTSRYALTAVRAKQFKEYRDSHVQIIDAILAKDVAAATSALRLDLLLKESDV